MKRSISGIQPSGILHIGNYFGAIKQFIESQDSVEGMYFVADYHSLTSGTPPLQLRENSYNIVLDYLALGLDPQKSSIFLQSDVPEHTELYWILSNLTTVSLMERGHSYKDKIEKGLIPNMGLLSYPILMAADILMYDADLVPVGKDQKQHLEMTRDIAVKYNEKYGEMFKLPEPIIVESLAVVPGTDGQKMSKSYGNTINMFAPKKELKKQIMSIVTDSAALEDSKNPDNNITQL
ncbi:MAG: tryptophan--tRNA ligase, partial [Fusobacteriaceae bacterium]